MSDDNENNQCGWKMGEFKSFRLNSCESSTVSPELVEHHKKRIDKIRKDKYEKIHKAGFELEKLILSLRPEGYKRDLSLNYLCESVIFAKELIYNEEG